MKLSFCLDRRRQCFLHAPPVPGQPLEQRVVADVEVGCPSSHALGLAVEGNPSSVSFVSILFIPSFPRAVARLVRAVIVSSFQGVLRGRTGPHVCQEVDERLAPASADGDPPAAVVLVANGLRVVASLLHHLPCFVLWRVLPAFARADARTVLEPLVRGRLGLSHLTFSGNDWVVRADWKHQLPAGSHYFTTAHTCGGG